MEKRCESCGEASAPHRLRHSIKRMPRVLALHMKRFQVGARVLVGSRREVAWQLEHPVCLLGGAGAGTREWGL